MAGNKQTIWKVLIIGKIIFWVNHMTVHDVHASKAVPFRAPIDKHTIPFATIYKAPAQSSQPIAVQFILKITCQFILTNGSTDVPTEVCIKQATFQYDIFWGVGGRLWLSISDK